MQRLPVLLDFENRKSLFRKELSKRDRLGSQIRSPLQLTVKRGQVYSDSFRHLNYRSSDELKAKLSVKFEGEEGADYGGLTREWYLVISREMLNPDIGLFVPSHGSKLAFQCNPASDIIFANEDFVHFRFVGRIVGKALYDNMLLDAHFTRAMYKAILRLPLSLSDVQDTEPEVFKSLHWLLHNDVSGLDLFFDTERYACSLNAFVVRITRMLFVSEKFGVRETFELKEGGSGIPVTNENKAEYVKLLSEHRLRNSVRKQMQVLLSTLLFSMPCHESISGILRWIS
jgi:E3 ubiquitin-protein ligase HUWE1